MNSHRSLLIAALGCFLSVPCVLWAQHAAVRTSKSSHKAAREQRNFGEQFPLESDRAAVATYRFVGNSYRQKNVKFTPNKLVSKNKSAG